MKLQALSLENFRAFPFLAMEFRPDLTVLTGQNGAGKSSVLDAAALALGTYAGGFSGVSAPGLSPADARLEPDGRRETGPVRIAARLDVSGHPLAWSRTLEGGRTLSADAGELLQYAAALEEHLRRKAPVTLPLVAHYGADRAWFSGREAAPLQKIWIKNRQSGYLGCLDAAAGGRLLLSWFESMAYAKQQKLQAMPGAAGDDSVLPELYAVTEAMAACYKSAFPDAKDVSFSFDTVQGELEIMTTGPDGRAERLPLRLLGRGVQSALLLVADIAYRMAVLNPRLGAELTTQTPGIVLIDEIDLHLHPAWQKHILADLQRIFPLVQFIVTTNSPVVLANVDAKCVRVMRGGQVYRASAQTYARPVDAVLREAMQADPRPDAVRAAIASFYDALEARALDEAKEKLARLTECLGETDGDVVRAAAALEQVSQSAL